MQCMHQAWLLTAMPSVSKGWGNVAGYHDFIPAGTRPEGIDVVNYTPVGVATFAAVRGLSLQPSLAYFATVRAEDFTGKWSLAVSRPITIDTTPPSLQCVELQGITEFQNRLRLEWSLPVDEESGIENMEWGLGSRPGSSDVMAWQEADFERGTMVDIATSHLGLYPGQLVFATLKVDIDMNC